jgi:hypothetical protein
VIDFRITKNDKPKMAAQFFERVIQILEKENVVYDKQVIAEILKKHFPDNRRILNELQRYSATGKIDSGILSNAGEASIDGVVRILKEKNFTEMRKWVAQNLDNDTNVIFRKLFDKSNEVMTTESIAQLVLILADYQYKAAFVVDQEINMVACLTEIMASCEFK